MKRYKVNEVTVRIAALEESSKRESYLLNNIEELVKEPDHVLYVQSLDSLAKILTPKRMELINCLSRNPGLTVNELAKKLKREQEAISRDLHELEAHMFVELTKNGRHVQCEAKYNKISISLA